MAGTPELRKVTILCASSTSPVAAATVRPGAAGGPPSLPGAPGRVQEGLYAPTHSPHSQQPQPATSSQTQVCPLPPPPAALSTPKPSSLHSADESGAQTARTIQSAPSLHPTAVLLWIEDAMNEAWWRRRAAQAAASRSPERARSGLGP